jgi:hypothetical protein
MTGNEETATGRRAVILGVKAPICADDAEAIEEAKRLVRGWDIELWSGDRLVTRLGAKTK